MSSNPVNAGAIKTFGDVRSMVQQPANPEAWEALCHALGNWPDARELEDVVLPYVLTHLERWPDAVRTCPERWIDGVIRGARAPVFSVVRALMLGDRRLRDVDMLTLARAPALEHITHLDVGDNPIGMDGLEHLVDTPHAKGLRTLVLDGLGLGVSGMQMVATSGHLRALEALSWRRGSHGLPSIRALTDSKKLGSVGSLDLSDNESLDKRALEALSQSAMFEELHTLALDGVPLKMSGLSALVRRADPRRLRRLSLREASLHDAALQMLARSPNLEGLLWMDLRGHIATDAGVSAMARSTFFPSLVHLDLRARGLTEASAQAWSQATGYPNLTFLGLPSSIGAQGAALLARAPSLSEQARSIYKLM